MRRLTVLIGALASVLAFAATAAAAPPEVFQISFDDPAVEAEEAAFVSGICGFPITVDLDGKVVVHVFDGGQTLEIDSFNIRGTYTNPANGKTYKLIDSGPDIAFVRDGKAFVAVTGRSLTGSGVIGRVVFDLETGEAVFTAGNDRGFYVDVICSALAN
jgi:hypothetical protein